MYLTAGIIILFMILLANGKCDECKSYSMVYDENKGESFCFKCGLIHQENYAVFSVVSDILKNSKNSTD